MGRKTENMEQLGTENVRVGLVNVEFLKKNVIFTVEKFKNENGHVFIEKADFRVAIVVCLKLHARPLVM